MICIVSTVSTPSSPDPGANSSRRVRIGDVARVAGVSPGTVSNVLNHPHKVTAPRRRRVEAAMQQLGFVRNESARQLRTGASRTLGLLVRDAGNPFFADVSRGVEEAAFEQGWLVLISNSARQDDRESVYLKLFAARQVDGLIVIPNGDVTERLLDLQHKGIWSVLLDQRSSGPTLMSVSLDDVRGGEIAMSHLLRQGHRQIAFVGGGRDRPLSQNRLSGAVNAISQSGLSIQLTVLEANPTIEGGESIGNKLVAMPAPDRPTAVFATSDLIAIEISHVLLRHGIRVPDDIAVVGYDDIEFARQAAVPLTTIRQPAYDMGRTATEMLISQLEGRPPTVRHAVFQPELVIRESCPSNDPSPNEGTNHGR